MRRAVHGPTPVALALLLAGIGCTHHTEAVKGSIHSGAVDSSRSGCPSINPAGTSREDTSRLIPMGPTGRSSFRAERFNQFGVYLPRVVQRTVATVDNPRVLRRAGASRQGNVGFATIFQAVDAGTSTVSLRSPHGAVYRMMVTVGC